MATTVRQRTRRIAPATNAPAQETMIGSRVLSVARTESLHVKALRAFNSNQLVDPFVNHLGKQSSAIGGVINPSFNMMSLLRLPRENNVLGQCIDAMVTNVSGFGFRLEYVGPEGQEDSDAALVEHQRLTDFLEHPNPEMSLSDLRERKQRDYETIGNAYLELSRDARNEPAMLFHVPGHLVRITKADSETTPVRVQVPRDGQLVNQVVPRRFRRFVQMIGTKKVYFKEFGDPRMIDPATGKPEPGLALEDSATELIHFSLYSPGEVYGLPRWIAQIPSILGSREMEMTNLEFFKDNAIPAMAVLVAGGVLTGETLRNIEDHFNAVRGRQAMNRLLVMEASTDTTTQNPEGTSTPVPKIDLKMMVNERQKDALFGNYDEANMMKVRTSFRLPPIFIGRCHSEDTEYLTTTGWKTYDQVTRTDTLATLNVVTELVEYQRPTARHAYDYDGDLVHMYNRGLDALVTPNHLMRVRPTVARARVEKPWEVVEAGRLGLLTEGNSGYCELPVAGNSDHPEVAVIEVPGNIRRNAREPGARSKNASRDAERDVRTLVRSRPRMLAADEFLEFLGYFVAEGHAYDNGVVALSQNDGPVADKMVTVLRLLGFNPGVYQGRENQLTISFGDVGLARWLRDYCGHDAKNKRLPDLCLRLCRRQAEILLDALVDGDGSVDRRGSPGSFAYTTTSHLLAGQIQAIGIQHGYHVNLTRVERPEKSWNDIYRMYAHRDVKHLIHPVTQVERVPYRGKVACFTVPNGTLVTRRNGRVLISHNSDDYTRATAGSSMVVAENQVFGPERAKEDDLFNTKILAPFNPKFWEFRSRPPKLSDPENALEALDTLDQVGAMTPNTAIATTNELLDMNIDKIEEPWGDLPITVVLALLAGGGSAEDLGLPSSEEILTGDNVGGEPEESDEPDDVERKLKEAIMRGRKPRKRKLRRRERKMSRKSDEYVQRRSDDVEAP